MTGPRTLVRTRTCGDVYVLETVDEVMDEVRSPYGTGFVRLTSHVGPLFLLAAEIVLVDTLIISINQDGES